MKIKLNQENNAIKSHCVKTAFGLYFKFKEKKHKLLESIFSDAPKEVPQTEIKVVNYNQVNQITNRQTQSNLGNALKKAKLENIKRNSRR